MMRKFLFILGIVLLGSALVCAGVFIGFQIEAAQGLIGIPMFQEQLVLARIKLMVVSQLDEGKIDDAKAFVNSELDSAILVLDCLMDSCQNKEDKAMAKQIIAQIAEHRVKYPVWASDDKVTATINDILNKAMTEADTASNN